MCIVTRSRIDLTIGLIDRMKRLFYDKGLVFDNKETVIELNGAKIEAFPSHDLGGMRGLQNVYFILLDESGPNDAGLRLRLKVLIILAFAMTPSL
jgi:hypothetical protein